MGAVGKGREELVCHSSGCPHIVWLYYSIWSIEVHPRTLLTHPSSPTQGPQLCPSLCYYRTTSGHVSVLDIIWGYPQKPLGDISAVHAPLWAKGTQCFLGPHLLRWPYSHYYLGVLPAPQIFLEKVMWGFLLLITSAVPLGLFYPQGLERFFFLLSL